jgi:hypothetical protein
MQILRTFRSRARHVVSRELDALYLLSEMWAGYQRRVFFSQNLWADFSFVCS